jgi:glycine hydroxymethyltransferase
LLDRVNITCNKNTIPYDTQKPFIASGIRLGSPAMTSRGLDEDDFRLIADLIDKALTHPEDEDILEDIRQSVKTLTDEHPLDYV